VEAKFSTHTQTDGWTDRLTDRQYDEAYLYSKNHNSTHSKHCALNLPSCSTDFLSHELHHQNTNGL